MKNLFSFLIFSAVASSSFAQLQINAPATAYTIDFTGFAADGFLPVAGAGQLSSNTWSATGFSDGNLLFGGVDTTTNTDFKRGISTGNVSTGGIYAFNTGSGNIILGVQPTQTDFTPGDFRLQMQNNTGDTISSIKVTYDIYFLDNEERSNSLNFSHSPDNTTYTNISSLDYATDDTADVTPLWASVSRTTIITGLNITNSAMYYVRWEGNDVSGANNRDEYGIDNISIMANPPPITAYYILTAFCFGDSTCFYDQSTSNNGAINYWNWNFGDGGTDTVQNPCHTYTATGTYSVTLTVANINGDTASTTAIVIANPLPVAGFSSTVNGGTVNFSDVSVVSITDPVASWSWSFPGGAPSSSTLQNPVVTYSVNGTYTACLTIVTNSGCIDSTCQTIAITVVGINSLNTSSSIIVFPTVSENGIFTIRADGNPSGQSAIKEVEVYNAVGEKKRKNSGDIKSLNLSDFPSGIYFVKILSDKDAVTKKVMIVK